MSGIIIEFAGLPGCGKSTVSGHLTNKLREQGYHIKTREDIIRGVEKGKKILKNPYFWLNAFRLFLYSRRYKNIDKYDYCIRILHMKHQLEKSIRSPVKEVIILDEGMIQDLTAIAYDEPVFQNRYTKLALKVLGDIKDYVYCINCRISLASNIERIRKRGRCDRRYGASKCDDELKRVLTVKSKNIDFFIKESGIRYLNVDMENGVNEIADLIESEWIYETNKNVLQRKK